MTKIRVYPIYSSDADWLINHSPDVFEKVSNFVQADMVVLPGGADWNPKLYEEQHHPKTGTYSYGDYDQLSIVFKAILTNKYLIGICRGAQGLCILNGGKLIQDVTGHGGYPHEITTNTGDYLITNSLHHQMLDLSSIPDVNWELLAWSSTPLSKHYEGALGASLYTNEGFSYKDLMIQEPEIVKFKDIYGLGIQGHPEMNSMPRNTIDFIVKQLLIGYGEFQNNGNSPKHNYTRTEFIKKRLNHIALTLTSNRVTIIEHDKIIFNKFIIEEKKKFKIEGKQKLISLFDLPKDKNESKSKNNKHNKDEKRDKPAANRSVSRKNVRWSY